MTKPTTLRNIVGLPDTPPALADSALVLIDCQNTYREGIMALSGVEAALDEAARLLAAARKLGIPVFHIQHDAGPGSPYDISQPIGAIADKVAPAPGEPVIVKKRQRRLSDVDAVAISLFAKGLTTGEISAHFAWGYLPRAGAVYGVSVSRDTISRITDKVVEWGCPRLRGRCSPGPRVRCRRCTRRSSSTRSTSRSATGRSATSPTRPRSGSTWTVAATSWACGPGTAAGSPRSSG